MAITSTVQPITQATLSRLAQRPWRAFLLVLALQPVCFAIVGFLLFGVLRLPMDIGNMEATPTVALFTVGGLLSYVLVPFLLRLPNGKRSFGRYLDDIRLTSFRPFLPLLLLTLSCVLILILCQGSGSLVYRMMQGKPLTAKFIRQVFNLAATLPPQSTILFRQMFSSLEEVAFRGVLLTMLLRKYSPRMAIVYSSAAFGLLHLGTLATGRPIVFVLGQVTWAFLFGLFYGYIFLKTNSLIPSMIIHWLSNVFQSRLTEYWNSGSPLTQALYGVVFGFGMAAVLSILWVRFFVARWFPPRNRTQLSELGANNGK
jgi:membrane protease YdiL (CAAX protease family)